MANDDDNVFGFLVLAVLGLWGVGISLVSIALQLLAFVVVVAGMGWGVLWLLIQLS